MDENTLTTAYTAGLPLTLSQKKIVFYVFPSLCNWKSAKDRREGSFYKQAIYDSFQWNLEPM